ncbi:MAG: four helix bundle protein [Phycisphaerales bacterium]
MATFERFEDIEAWKQARQLARLVYDVSGNGDFSRDRDLKSQIRRAATSVMSNIAEGFERGGNREFVNFLSMARGSVGEVRSQLYVAVDQQYIDSTTFRELNDMAHKISRMPTGLMSYLNSTTIRGKKFENANRRPTTANCKPQTVNFELPL